MEDSAVDSTGMTSNGKDKKKTLSSRDEAEHRTSSSSSTESGSSINSVLDDLLTQLDSAFAKKFAGFSGAALEDAINAAFDDYDTCQHTRDKSGGLDRSAIPVCICIQRQGC